MGSAPPHLRAFVLVDNSAAEGEEVNRLPLPFLLFVLHTPDDPVVVAEPIMVPPPHYYSAELRRTNAVRSEAQRWDVPFQVAIAVSRSEVHNADSTARNTRTGALGILQIHPVNFGTLDPLCYGPGDMTNLKRNSCYGMVLLRGYYDQEGTWSAALRLYLGYKTNTAALLSYLDDVIDHMAGL
jgi:soluble lytic murein transglycosylase-like protein